MDAMDRIKLINLYRRQINDMELEIKTSTDRRRINFLQDQIVALRARIENLKV